MIAETAQIGKHVVIGAYVVIEDHVVIGDHVTIGHHTVLKRDTIIGDGVHVQDGVIAGRSPSTNQKMTRKPTMDLQPLIIGNDVQIGSHCVLYRGSTIKEGVFIGDLASVREHVQIGGNSIVGRHVTVENNTTIGENVTIQTNSYVTADMVIEDDVFIGPCLSSSNDKYMGMKDIPYAGPFLQKGAKIGAHTTLLPGIVIGERAIVGAGSVVTKDVECGETVIGNAAKKMK